MEDVFGPDGLLARHHPAYEYRPGQVRMASAVHEVLESGGVALIEAGTGTGKTLAYLIPALAAEQRVIVSTATKNLQEQLFHKDLPFLQSMIPREFSVACMKGRSNYVCLHRLKRASENPILDGLEEVRYFDQVRRWAEESETGDRAELSDLPESLGFWPHIDARSDACLGQKCPDFDACFVTRMRRRAMEADVVIVNHHLFFADLALRGGDYGRVLPDYSNVILDEAHELEDVASSYFGCSVSNYRINDLMQDAQKLGLSDPREAEELDRSIARLSQRATRFWFTFIGAAERGGKSKSDLRRALTPAMFFQADRGGEVTATEAGESLKGLLGALDRVIASLAVVTDAPPERDNIERRAHSLKFDLEFIAAQADPGFVYWCEKRGRGVYLHSTPIDVSAILNEKLFGAVRSAILTSATMTAGGEFHFIKERLGTGDARTLLVDSHFDFRRQAVVYLPPRMPDPRSDEFADAAVAEILRILEASSGRAFVLFTSVSSMKDAYNRASPHMDFPVFIQGEASKTSLLDRFRNTPNSVLFATSSFWQGVDVQGEALSCVIIFKLPFAVPTDPVVSARQNHIDKRGGNSFYEYSVPEAIITLKQGLGRLIRSTTDRGILSILDPRLRTKSYGRVFLASLPPVRITNDVEDAASIFSR